MQTLVIVALFTSPDAVFLGHEALLRLGADTALVEVSDEAIVPLSASGVARFSVLSIPFTRGSDSVAIELAELRPVRPGRPVTVAAVLERPRSGLSAAGRLEGTFREYLLEFGGLEIGDTILIRTRRMVDRLPMAPLVDYSFFFQGRDSLASSSFRLEWPCLMELHVWQLAGPEPVDRVAGDVRYMTWESGPASPVEALPFSVPVDETAARVVISSADAQQVSRTLFESLDPGTPDSATEALLDSLVRSTDGSPEALSAVVSSMITYAGAEIGADPGYTPQPPSLTLSRRSGVCRDMAVLLVALLRTAGVEAWTVLSRSSPRLDPLVGSRSFDHMIVMAVCKGDTSWLDPSADAGGGGAGMRGLRVLPLTPEGSMILELADPVGLDTLDIEMDATLSAGMDTLRATMRVSFAGGAEDLWRGMMRSVPPAERPEALRMLFGALPGSDLDLVGEPGNPEGALSVAGTALYQVPLLRSGNGYDACIPGLDEIDQAGTRMAAILLAGREGSDRMHVETPLLECLRMTIEVQGAIPGLPDGITESHYRCGWEGSQTRVVLSESALLAPVWPGPEDAAGILSALLLRGSPGNRVLHILGRTAP